MNDISKTSTSKRWTIALIAVFMLMIWLPTLDTFFHIDRTLPHSENRNLAAFPKFPSDRLDLPAYLSGLEAYFNDHFGFRKFLVQWHSKSRWALFKDHDTRSVLVGKNGWLFYTQRQMIDHYSGLLQFTLEQLHDWQVLLEKRRDWLAKRGIAYLFVVTPDKYTIYPEELPDWAVKVNPQTKLDQFIGYMREHSTVPVLDLRNVVRNGKKIHPTFFKTDVHWNLFGGFVAYQEVMRTLVRQRPDLENPLLLTSFVLTNQVTPEMDGGGDLAKILGLYMIESNSYCLFPKRGLPAFTIKIGPLDHPKELKSTENAHAKGQLIVFQDSFAMNWIQFLAYHFNHVTYLWQYDLNRAYIEERKPDIVISEMNESFFNIEDPKKLMTKEALN